MVGLVMTGIIAVSAMVVIPNLSYVNLLYVDQQQLRNTALVVFNAMLLGTGSPSNWGSKFPFNQTDVKAFGLAYSEQSLLYVLDKDKVQRLDRGSPWYIEYSYIRDLLGLEDYGFSLSIFRPFTVDWDLEIDDTENQVWFAVNVTRNEDGRPIPNAQVDVTTLCLAEKSQKDEPTINITRPKTYFTDALGRCEGTETVNPPTGYTLKRAVAVLKITVAGISTMVVAQTEQEMQKVLKIESFGDTITLSFRGELINDSKGERRIFDVMSYSYDALAPISWFDGRQDPPTSTHITHGIGYDYWSKDFPGLSAVDPALLLFTLSVPNPRRLVIVAGPFSLWEPSRVFSVGTESVSAANSILRRYVVVSGMTYITELTLWKEKP